MTDTVKLIIEIPKEAKQAFDNAYSNDLRGGYYDCGGVIGKAIQNGTPLDDVTSRIINLRDSWERDGYEDEAEALNVALRYINEESEDGE